MSLVFVAGCTSNAVAPSSNNYQDRLEWLNKTFATGGPALGPGLGECPVLYDTSITEWVDSHASSFKFVNGKEKIEFKLPDHALTSPLQLTLHATKYQAPFGSFWLLDCGPDGTVFAKPLEVIPNNEITQNNCSVLFYFNPVSGEWEVEQIAASTGSQLLINHFSKYGIAD
jgi:hypothetical protein